MQDDYLSLCNPAISDKTLMLSGVGFRAEKTAQRAGNTKGWQCGIF